MRASSFEASAVPSVQSGQCLQELSGLRIGMWKSRAHESLYLLVLPRRGVFVFVVETAPRPTATSTVDRKASFSSPRLNSLNASPIFKQFASASPFSHNQCSATGTVFGFEVGFEHVAGVNYQNPLVRQGRLTVEAFAVEKREFRSMEALKGWYGVEADVACEVCGEARAHVRPTSATKKRLQFGAHGGLDRNDDEGNEDNEGNEAGASTDVSSFAFCVHGREDGLTGGEVDDDATSGVVGCSSRPEVRGKRNKSPWSALKLRRNGNASVSKSSPSTENLPRLTIPAKNSSDDQRASPAEETQAYAKTYTYRTISAEFTNPHVPCVLAPIFKQHTPQSERLLKMYESGLPTWAIFLPSYGMYYRPWLRSVTWISFYVFSVVSLTLGFYDLYKTLPGLQDALTKLVESYQIGVWWPITSAYQWIESHAQLRLSILLTYLFGKSELFYSINIVVMQWLSYVFEPVRVVVMPLVWLLWAPVRLLFSLGSYSLGLAYSPLTFAWSVASRVDMMQAARGGAGVSSGWITVSEAMRQSLVTAMRAANNVWKFVMNMCGGVSRHRMTLSRRVQRNWGRAKDAAMMVVARVYVDVVGLVLGKDIRKGALDAQVSTVTMTTAASSDQNSLSFSNAFGSSNEEEEVKSNERMKHE